MDGKSWDVLPVQAGVVHRDLLWENTARDVSRQQFSLLDLEGVAPRHQVPGFHLKTWGVDVLQGNLYSCASDLQMLGKMLHEHRSLLSQKACARLLEVDQSR